MRSLIGWQGVGACLLLAGCSAAPRAPTDFSLARAAVVAGAAEPQITVDGPDGKGRAAAGGAGKGGGVGLLVAGLGCLPAGFLAPACFAMVAPAGLVVGAATGAAVAAHRADSAEEVEAKRELLRSVLIAPDPHSRLARNLATQAREVAGVDLPMADSASAADRPAWALRLVVAEFATAGSGSDVPYALQLSANVDVEQTGSAQHVFVKRYQATGATKLTTSQWALNTSDAARTEMDTLMRELAIQMVQDLAPADISRKKREDASRMIRDFVPAEPPRPAQQEVRSPPVVQRQCPGAPRGTPECP